MSKPNCDIEKQNKLSHKPDVAYILVGLSFLLIGFVLVFNPINFENPRQVSLNSLGWAMIVLGFTLFFQGFYPPNRNCIQCFEELSNQINELKNFTTREILTATSDNSNNAPSVNSLERESDELKELKKINQNLEKLRDNKTSEYVYIIAIFSLLVTSLTVFYSILTAGGNGFLPSLLGASLIAIALGGTSLFIPKLKKS